MSLQNKQFRNKNVCMLRFIFMLNCNGPIQLKVITCNCARLFCSPLKDLKLRQKSGPAWVQVKTFSVLGSLESLRAKYCLEDLHPISDKGLTT